jgi:hypothetical protein
VRGGLPCKPMLIAAGITGAVLALAVGVVTEVVTLEALGVAIGVISLGPEVTGREDLP